ncbi:YebC/PmpR family DNA-binding transcriptional regulator [Myxococcota bacterium]|nr:YebC/PmpR family DNA-binding transcriptional regulator [Myxococcota bacterium]
MSGHSKWATIKRKKGAVDAAKGKIFTKLVREITTAARMGGGDPDGNPRLRAAVVEAKSNRMPAENVVRAIKRGTGTLEGPAPEELLYEGYGAGGVAFIVEALTDNRNRTIAEVRTVFTKLNGSLGATGSVAWMFKKEGHFVFDASKYEEEALMDSALEAGADDVSADDDSFLVVCDPKLFAQVLTHFDKAGMEYDSARLTMIPENTIKVEGNEAEQVLRMAERLEDLDDVQKVYANFDIEDAELERIAGDE